MKRKQQQILYGLLALVIIFIIYKCMFQKTDNFSIGSPSCFGGLCSSRPCNHSRSNCYKYDECEWVMQYDGQGDDSALMKLDRKNPGRCEKIRNRPRLRGGFGD